VLDAGCTRPHDDDVTSHINVPPDQHITGYLVRQHKAVPGPVRRALDDLPLTFLDLWVT
jgi:hypothetical protein